MDDLEEKEAEFKTFLEKFKKKNGENSFNVCKKLAEEGDSKMRLLLGALYEIGDGNLRCYRSAYQWYNIAASKGEVLGVKFRDEIEKRMIPEDISVGQAWSRSTLMWERLDDEDPST